MLLASPEPATQLHDGYLNDRGQYALVRTTIQGREVFVLMADFDAIVSLSRKPAFDRLLQILDEIGDVPLVVMGDFNTPSDSIYFLPLRARLRDVFETAGDGYSQTWPMPLPVLDLDHIWVSHHFEIVRAEHFTSFQSDHRGVTADLNFH
jgi:endonuclease/exonuclease/phosphatase family metal-dependent hydrolase